MPHIILPLDCPDGVWYSLQPPVELKCNPVGEFLSLRCDIQQYSRYVNVTWYRTRCVRDAGVNGTAIEPEDTKDAFGVYYQFYKHQFNSSTFNTYTYILFQVTEATLGYYWCSIDDTTSKISVITPVIQNTSLPICTLNFVHISHSYKLGQECAAKGSPIIYTRTHAHRSSFCPSVRK